MRPLACWDCGFKSHRRHGRLLQVLSGRGLCDELVTRPDKSYRLWCVVMCDLEILETRRPWSTAGLSRQKQTKILSLYSLWLHDMTNFAESGAEEGILRMCAVQPFATVQEAAAHVYSVFLGTCHNHCWEILLCVPGDFCCCKIILLILYLFNDSVSSFVSTVSGSMIAKWKISKNVRNVVI
jgi:hypothetical protein